MIGRSNRSLRTLPRRALLSLAGAAAAALPGLRGSANAATPERAPALPQVTPATAAGFIERAFALRRQAVEAGDQGYGALVVLDGRVVGQSPSRVVTDGDPTAHAEMAAIRDAARRLGRRDLAGATLYSSSPPCPMCEAAAYWAGIARLVHGRDATEGGAPRLCG